MKARVLLSKTRIQIDLLAIETKDEEIEKE